MSEPAKFESRTGKIAESSSKVYRFITDIRNFERFIPKGTVHDWNATSEECSFEVSPVGRVKMSIVNREANSMVKYGGDGLNGTEFFMWVQMKEIAPGDTRVKLTIKADINPVIKMMAQKPVNDFLEKLVKGVESFNDWDSVAE